jgi:leucyl-tRNA synthetase
MADHINNYTINDMLTRQLRDEGLQRADAMGWDAFGLQRKRRHENGVPASGPPTTSPTWKSRCRRAWEIDWAMRLATCSPRYYKWNQWLFLKMLEKGVATADQVVNWDPVVTVLANEQVIDGKGWHRRHSGGKREIRAT